MRILADLWRALIVVECSVLYGYALHVIKVAFFRWWRTTWRRRRNLRGLFLDSEVLSLGLWASLVGVMFIASDALSNNINNFGDPFSWHLVVNSIGFTLLLGGIAIIVHLRRVTRRLAEGSVDGTTVRDSA